MSFPYLTDDRYSTDLECEVLERLHRMSLVYPCNDPECCIFWHLSPGVTWDDVDLGLIQIEMEE